VSFKPLPPLLSVAVEYTAQLRTPDLREFFEDLGDDAASKYLGECQHCACHEPRAAEGAPLCAAHELKFWSLYGVPSTQSPLADWKVIWVEPNNGE